MGRLSGNRPSDGLLQDLGFGGGVETGGMADGGSLMSGLDPAGLFSGVAGLFGGGAAAGGAAAGGADAAAAAGAGAAGAEAAGFSIADLLPLPGGAGRVMERAMSDPASATPSTNLSRDVADECTRAVAANSSLQGA